MPDSPEDAKRGSDYPGAPRWVKLFGVAVLLVVLLLLVLILLRGVGGGGHGPGRHLSQGGPAALARSAGVRAVTADPPRYTALEVARG